MRKRIICILTVLMMILSVNAIVSKNNNKILNKDLSSLPNSKYTQYLCGAIPISGSIPSDKIVELGPYPSSWDWRNATYNNMHGDWTTPVKNQGNCGSCWDFAAMGALEAIINIREGNPNLDPDLSEQYLLSCPPDSGGCNGWNAYYAYKYLKNNGGAIPESCFPYTASDSTPCSYKCNDWKDHLIPISSYGYYYKPSRDVIKSIVATKGPVVTDMAVYNDFFSYSGGIYEHEGYEPPSAINHQVVIVGYNDDGGYWICKNSWGKWWGENGFFKIAYGDCQIEYEIVYVDYDENSVDWPPVVDAGGPYYGKPNEEIAFNGSATWSDNAIVSWQWNFGDGTNGSGINLTHKYSQEGIYTAQLTVTDEKGYNNTDTTLVYIDGTPPEINIIQPLEKYLYIHDTKIMSLPFQTIIFGKITVKVDARDTISGVSRVEFYLNDKLVKTDTQKNYWWEWESTEKILGKYTIKAVAYDNMGNSAMATISLWRFW